MRTCLPAPENLGAELLFPMTSVGQGGFWGRLLETLQQEALGSQQGLAGPRGS